MLLAIGVGLSAFPLLLVPSAGLLLRLPFLAMLWGNRPAAGSRRDRSPSCP